MMNSQTELLLNKMNRLVEQSNSKNNLVCERWISLINKELHKNHLGDQLFSVMGASMAIKYKWENKWRYFIPRTQPATNRLKN